ncbi:MAG: tetratricopeptide repeat protein [Pirellulaceae bacterium]|nr:tetratricopeptide repeat protein [Pirellulaceae bacterium]
MLTRRSLSITLACFSLLLVPFTAYGQDDFLPPGSADSSGQETSRSTQGKEDDALALLRTIDPEAAKRYDEAVEMFHSDTPDYEAVIEKLNTLLTQPTSLPKSHYYRALSFAKLEEYDLALEAIGRAITLDQNNADFHIERGIILLELSKNFEATFDFQRAIALKPSSALALRLRGKAMLRNALEGQRLGEPTELAIESAIDSITRSIENEPTAEAYFDRGTAFLEQRDFEMAKIDLQKALDLEVTEPRYHEKLAFVYLLTAQQLVELSPSSEEAIAAEYRLGIASLGEVIKNFPTDPKAEKDLPPLEVLYATRAQSSIELALYSPKESQPELFESAISDCQKAFDLEPEFIPALYQKAIAQRLTEKPEHAIETLNHLLELSPDHGLARIRRGILRFHNGQLELAQNDFDLAQTSGDPRAYFWSGLVFATQENYSEAIRVYSESLKDNSQFHYARLNRGFAFLHDQQYERAIDDFNLYLSESGQEASPYYYRGYAHEQLGQTELAIASYRQALVLDPEYLAAQERLNELLDH